MNATCRLIQDGGVQGPQATIETTAETAFADAVAWSDGQPGHPWDGMLVTLDDGTAMECRCEDGAWEVV